MLVELSIGLSLGTSEEEVNIVYVSLGKRVLKQSLGFIGKTGTELSTVQYRILLGVCWGGAGGVLWKYKGEAAGSDLGQSFLQS